MKRFSLVLAAATVMSSPAWATSYNPQSTVDAVTVYPRGALVTRAAQLDLQAGDHEVIIADLPDGVDPASVRVEGLADKDVRIISVDVRAELVEVKASANAATQIQAQIADLRQALNLLERQLADVEVQRGLISALAFGAAADGPKISATDLGAVLELSGAQLSALTQKQNAIMGEQRKAQNALERLEKELNQAVPEPQRRTVVTLSVSSSADTKAEFSVRYGVDQASWRAAYDAALTLGESADDAQLAITRRAEVRQQTGEAWDDVALTLSTARPAMASAPPQMGTWIIDERKPIPAPVPVARSKSNIQLENFAQADEMGVAIAAAPMRQEVAGMETGGFDARYQISGRVDVENSGEMKSVTIGAWSGDAKLFVKTLPDIDRSAYLMTSFELDGDATWLPGVVSLARDGAFIGKVSVPLLTPGTMHELSFGVDDLIVVQQTEIDRQKGEVGLISTSATDERRTLTTITNRHGFDMPVVVVGRLPVSNNEAIKVTLLEDADAPDKREIDGARGIVSWERDLAADAELEIDFGYRVTWPKNMQISGL